MKTSLLVTICYLILSSCHNFSTNISESQTYFDSLTYSAYRWKTDTTGLKQELFIAHYLYVNKNGEFNAMVQDPLTYSKKYFKGILPDTLISQINNVLTDSLTSVYKSSNSGIYCGNSYSLDYVKAGNHNIQLAQDEFPVNLQYLFGKLDSVLISGNLIALQPFDLKSYHDSLIKKSIAAFGKLPDPKRIDKLPKIDISKFKK